MGKEIINQEEYYKSLVNDISIVYSEAQNNVVKMVNKTILHTYWQIGQHIVEFEQGGKAKAKYGKGIYFCFMVKVLVKVTFI
jgi:hypothetical protein